ncbi:hypothetical protein K227x_24670 [Rubripirellula lacrimiformis]|uniref:DUF3592 domain-containing protein n=1 Tax=Rubripirellula lacrimiformis TaxID=1930273 RepID=A0A517NAB5_9BACT|nr:hypothetical protein [Rubripirellula lacrimiformis]QDT04079.1 hypothetical protein K227x_24670 [Rubripirellula lacrimiformis]
MPRFPRSWIPRPWSKKRGKRRLSNDASGVAGEVIFYMLLFLVGVFGLSLVLINRFAPSTVASVPAQAFPTQAFSTSLSLWIFGILSLASLLSGTGGLIFRLMRINASSERRSAIFSRTKALEKNAIDLIGPASEDLGKFPSVPRVRSMTDSPGERLTYRLAAETDEKGIAGPATLALLWNAVWFVLLAVVVSGFWYGRPRWIVAMLLVPFAVIGIWAIRFFLAQLRQRAGVGPTIVEISHHPLVPGDTCDVYVSQTGRLKLRRLTVQLTCEEETFYRQGTDVRVDRHECFTQVLCKERDVSVDPMSPWEQQLEVELPKGVMHSFVGTHNAIRWKIVVLGESRPWPSFCRNFPVVVHPPGLPPKRSPR